MLSYKKLFFRFVDHPNNYTLKTINTNCMEYYLANDQIHIDWARFFLNILNQQVWCVNNFCVFFVILFYLSLFPQRNSIKALYMKGPRFK